MTRLEELRQIVADAFKEADTKEGIETLATINNKIDEVTKEHEDVINKNSELIKSYKDLIQHTSFKDDKKPMDPVGGSMPSFENMLNEFINK